MKLHTGGRPKDVAKWAIANRFGVSEKQAREANPQQLVKCADNSAIRILLGVGIKAQPGESWPVPELNKNCKSYHAGEWIRGNGY